MHRRTSKTPESTRANKSVTDKLQQMRVWGLPKQIAERVSDLNFQPRSVEVASHCSAGKLLSTRGLTLYYGTGFRISSMRIGELAAKAGVNIQTIRFYERQRLLRAPSRTLSGYRAYAEADLQRVKFIKRCQCLGFTLKEVKGLIETHDPKQSFRDPSTRRKKNLQITRERLQLIDEKMQLLKRMRQSLVAVLQQSESSTTSDPGAECTALREARKLEMQCACPRPVRRKKTS